MNISLHPPGKTVNALSPTVATLAPHQIQADVLQRQQQANLTREQMLAATFGTHMPIRLQFEREILSQHQRLPGLHSSFIGFETVTRRDVDISFEDYLNPVQDPMDRASYKY